MELQSLLGRLPPSIEENVIWEPRLFNLSRRADHEEVEGLIASGLVSFCHDTIITQLRDLISAREPSLDFGEQEIKQRIQQQLEGLDPSQYGTWVHYPWSRRLVHVLPMQEYRELRSDRNRYKITSEEQERLHTFKIGFLGLSVGQVIAMTMALEGVGGEFRLADMDTLDLSNLNRLGSGVHNLGINKAFIVARQILEIDPYFNLSLFPEGLSVDSLDRFLLEGGKLDLLVEECDDLFIKVRIRERAREIGIPVLMDTCDRGLIDIERFDLEPHRPLFHGLVGDLDAESLKGLDMADKVPYVLRMTGEDRISGRAVASMVEIGQTLSSLPQLASAVILGAGKSTDVARRILLGEFNSSGRYYVDVEEIVRDGAGEALAKVGPLEAECSLEVISPAQVEPLVFSPEALTEAEIRSIVGYGILAPSAGNCQPWKFVFRDGRLLCLHDVERSMSFLDFQYCATYLAFGAVVENVSLAAAGLGREAEVQLFPNPQDTRLVSEVRFSRSVSPHDQPELLDQIPWRVTNRKLGKRVPLNEQTLATLMRTAAEHGAELQLLTGDDELDEVGTILGAVDRFQFLSRIPHQEMMAELRWMPQEVEATRDGIDVATLEFSAADKAAIRIISSWPAMKMLGKIGGGKALEKPAKKAVAAASAVGLLSVKGTGPGSYFMGGRAMQQVWLTATAQGLVFHPMSGICYLFARLERGEGFSEKEARTLTRLRERYLGLFRLLGERAEVLLFRVARAAQPTARSLRRKLEDVLLFK